MGGKSGSEDTFQSRADGRLVVYASDCSDEEWMYIIILYIIV